MTAGRYAVRVVASLVLMVVAQAAAADRKWQAGTWQESGDTRTYVVLTDAVRLHLEDIPAGEKRAIDVSAGTPVKLAIEGAHVFVLDAKGAEHELRLLRTVDLNYTATGAGHFIKAIGADGLSVTLEDGSAWALDPRAQFFTADWQPAEGISVRRTDPENGFNYEIDNTDRDEGALARYSPN